MAVTAPQFVPVHRDEYYAVQNKAYTDAIAQASLVYQNKQILMLVEPFKPIHFGSSWVSRGYALPTGTTQKTLLTNCSIFPWGIFSDDTTFDYMQWYQGNMTTYIGDWYVQPIAFFTEHSGAWTGNIAHYYFKGDEPFSFVVHSTTYGVCPTGTVNAWLLAFVVMPSASKGTMITTS